MECDSICNFIPMSPPDDVINIINFIWERNNDLASPNNISAFYMLGLVTNGSGILRLRKREYPLRKGDIFFISPAVPFQIEDSGDLNYMYIGYLGLRGTKLMDTLRIHENGPVFSGFHTLIPFWENAIQSVTPVNLRILSESVLLYTFSELGRQIPVIADPVENSSLVLRIKKYIDENFSDPDLSLDAVCNHFSYSQNYISSMFRKHMDVSFSRYLTTIRIQYACALMESGHRNISQIAEKCGFSDRLYFSKVFRSVMGVPPTAHIRTITSK